MGFDRLWALAAHQDGALATGQFEEAGVPSRTGRDRARREALARPQARVVLAPGALDAFRTRTRAALLSAGGRAMAGGRAALHLHGIVDTAPARIDVLLPYDRNVRLRPPARARRSRTVLAGDLTIVDGLACATVERALFDVAAWEGPRLGVDLALDAVQRRRTTPGRILQRADQRLPLRGQSAIVRACDLAASGIESAFERLAFSKFRRAGLPRPVPQCPVEVAGRTLHLDFGWPEQRVGVECVGLRPHGDRDAQRRDLRRLNSLRHAPWAIVWVEWHRLLFELDDLVAEVATELTRAAARS